MILLKQKLNNKKLKLNFVGKIPFIFSSKWLGTFLDYYFRFVAQVVWMYDWRFILVDMYQICVLNVPSPH